MIVAILQARMSSTRLPGKVMKPLLNKPMLYRQIERIQLSKRIDKLVVATSNQSEDELIVKLCKEIDVCVFRGDLNNVLDRYYQAATFFNAKQIVRLTADCPLADPHLIDELIAFHLQGGYEYSSNTVKKTFPDGLDAEILSMPTLAAAWQAAQLASEKEHVTPFVYNNPNRFSLGFYKNNQDLSSLRWTVDYIEDFDFVTQVYEALYPSNPAFTTQDILKVLKHIQK